MFCLVYFTIDIRIFDSHVSAKVIEQKCDHSFHVKLAIHLSFLAFRHVRALLRELFREIANQSLYTSHNIADFVHPWFCEKLDEKFVLLSSLTFHESTWRERQNARREKWLARWFTKCHLYTSRFYRFADIFSHSRQFDDKCIACFMNFTLWLSI